jgi:hypothetical protein
MVLISNIVSLIQHTPGSQSVGEQRNRGIPRRESLPQNSGIDHIDEQEATLERHRMNHASSSNLRDVLGNPSFDQIALPLCRRCSSTRRIALPPFQRADLSENGSEQEST